jgi:hypothetical protein
VTGEDAAARVARAKAAALAAVEPHVQRLSERVVEKSLREQVLRRLPGREEIATGAPVAISIDVAGTVAAESARLRALLAAGDLAALIARYPLRETQALAQVALNLGFQDQDQYEGAVRTLLASDEKARAAVRALFGTLGDDMAAG